MNNQWHKISAGNFPKTTGDYLTVCRNKNMEDGIFIYEVVYYTGESWGDRINWEDIIAWCEIPEYKDIIEVDTFNAFKAANEINLKDENEIIETSEKEG